MRDRLMYALVPALAVGALSLFAPQTATACGGFFCDGGPTPMPVDQTGENIVFIPEDGSIEVQIQIQYMGEPQQFAWVIPVLSIPTDFRVGSQQLFDNIMSASVPVYGITGTQDDCSFGDAGGGFGSATAADGGTGGDAASSGGDSDGGPTVVIQDKPVGAFEITVLEGGTAQELVDWLNDNGYAQDDEAVPIFEEYLAANHKFVAVRLQGGASVEEIHPIALHFEHNEACVPLKLTRIAAVDDMEVRTYFLGDARIVPKNYKHVLVNPLKIDWPNQATNYKDVIRRAVDADMANGRAWVTEYAGANTATDTGLVNASWNADAFVGLDALQAVAELQQQGMVICQYDFPTDMDICQGVNPMIDPLLTEFIIPAGVDAYAFITDPSTFADQIDPEQYGTGEEFAALLVERVIAPGEHAARLLADNPYLTRMYTIISPHEMMEDPMFHENEMLEDVPNVRTATARLLCNNDVLWTLPDDREVYLPLGATWPDIGGDEYWEEEVQETPEVGAPIVLVNNTQQINQALQAYNAGVGWDGSQGNGGAEGGDGSSGEGCGCRQTAPAGALWALGLLLGIGFLRKRS